MCLLLGASGWRENPGENFCFNPWTEEWLWGEVEREQGLGEVVMPLGWVRAGLVPTLLSCSEQLSLSHRLPSTHKRTDLRTGKIAGPIGMEEDG